MISSIPSKRKKRSNWFNENRKSRPSTQTVQKRINRARPTALPFSTENRGSFFTAFFERERDDVPPDEGRPVLFPGRFAVELEDFLFAEAIAYFLPFVNNLIKYTKKEGRLLLTNALPVKNIENKHL